MDHTLAPRLRRPMRARLLILPCVVSWALLVRLHGLDAMSMWMDELRQVSYYAGGWRTIMYNAAAQAQTPLDYWVGWCFSVFGQSDFVLRLPAALFGTVSVGATYCVGRRLLSPAASGLAALTVASAPYAIHYSQEARPYAVFWCLQMLSLLALSRAWRRNGVVDWVLVTLCLAACLLSRTLAPLAFCAGLMVWSAVEVWRGRHVRRRLEPRPTTAWWRRRSVRLWIILGTLAIPVLQLLSYIIRVQHRRSYIAGELAEALNWHENLATMGHIVWSWLVFTQPLGIILVPLAVYGVVLSVRLQGRRGRDARMLIVGAGAGYVIHVMIYVVLVAGIEPKPVYWAYMLPFVALAAAFALESLAGRMRGAIVALWCRGAIYFAVACAVMVTASIDRREVVFDKPDWRSASRCLLTELDTVDVAFYHYAVPFGAYRPAFMAAPHYWPSDRHIVDIADTSETARRIYSGDRLRVGIMVRCPQEVADNHSMWQRIAWGAGLEVFCFDQFIVLVSASPRPAIAAFNDLSSALLQGLSKARIGVVEIHAARAALWRARGEAALAAVEIDQARALAGHDHAERFGRQYAELLVPAVSMHGLRR